jgi:paraquat-inducible protein B
MPDDPIELPPVPEAKRITRSRTRFSAVWLVPLVAAAAGTWVAVTRILSTGPTITIVFRTAEGLEAGKTKIHYNGVDVGTLSAIRLSDDHHTVIATAQMEPHTEDFLVEDTEFWVVKPRISGASVSGLGTLISGSYIGMSIGPASGKTKKSFVALDTQPVVTGGTPGRFFVLKAPTLGSLDTGTPLYFRRFQVGQVASYTLDSDGKALTVKIFVEAPYDRFVTRDTRFWQASGIDMSLTASGISVQTQSLLSILVGGIAFETPPSDPVAAPADANAQFRLFDDRDEAFRPPVHDPQSYRLVFTQSVHGLTLGAPVEFQGIRIGEVSAIDAEFDAKTLTFAVPVTVRIDPERFGVKLVGESPDEEARVRTEMLNALVAHGARAQLRSGSLITGSLYVAFDFFPGAAPATVDWSTIPPELPTVPSDLAALEASITGILKKIDQLPLRELSDDVRKTIVELNHTLAGVQKTLTTADDLIRPSSDLRIDVDSTLQEVTRAARGLRLLADYLERHPEALLRGKPGEAK